MKKGIIFGNRTKKEDGFRSGLFVENVTAMVGDMDNGYLNGREGRRN